MDRLVRAQQEPSVDPAGPPPADEALVRLRDVSVSYASRRGLLSRGRAEVRAVDNVSLVARRGATLGIVGGTGAGKSTVARVVMGMVPATDGTVEVLGHDLSRVHGQERVALERLRQVVLQDPYSSLDPRMRVGDIVAEPLTLGRRVTSRAKRAATRERVAELLALVGLPPERADAYPHQFSGGQRQRISIARALAPRPQLIVLDEPTSALDVSVRAQILTLLKTLQDQLGLTYLVISHDLMTVAYLSSTVAVMYQGRIVEMGPTEPLFRSPRHPYTVRLLASIPGVTRNFLDQPRSVIGPAGSLPPEACRYASSCALRTHLGAPARCAEEDPDLVSVGPGHSAACHFSDEVPGFAARSS